MNEAEIKAKSVFIITQLTDAIKDLQKRVATLEGNPDTFEDTQQEDPAPKQPQKKIDTDVDIGAELEDMFSNEIFQFLEVQDNGDKVQMIQYIKKVEGKPSKWTAINNFLREYGYKYYKVEKALGYWGF